MNIGYAFEPRLAEQFRTAFRESELESPNSTVFFDCGINIGSHALFLARNGCRVYGVDPIGENLLRVRKTDSVRTRVCIRLQSALRSDSNAKM